MSKQLAFLDDQFTDAPSPMVLLEVLDRLDRRVTKNKRRLINGLLKKRPAAFEGPLGISPIAEFPYV